MKEPIITRENPNLCEDDQPSGFKITHAINGVETEVELSCKELFDAFVHHETINYKADVETTLDELECAGELLGHKAAEIIANHELMAAIWSEYSRNRNKNSMDWHSAVSEAITDMICEAETNGTLNRTEAT